MESHHHDHTQPHEQGHTHRILVHHDASGSDIEMPVADHEKTSESQMGSSDEKHMKVLDTEHQGEFREEPKQNNKQKFRRCVRKYKPVIHILIWMLVTAQVTLNLQCGEMLMDLVDGGLLVSSSFDISTIGLSRCCCGWLSRFV